MIKTIIIIDDDLDFVEACRSLLQAMGYDVDFEDQGKKALSKLKARHYDLIILDVIFNDEAIGFEIATQIVQEEDLRDIPVILLSGCLIQKGPEDMDRLRNIRAVLDKPVKPMVLLDLIQRMSQ